MRRKIGAVVASTCILICFACGKSGLETDQEIEGEFLRDSKNLGYLWEDGADIMTELGRPLNDDLYVMSFDISAGGTVVFEVTSRDFDPLLILVDKEKNVLVWNDDWDEETDAFIVYEDPPSNSNLLVVSLDGRKGEFLLTCEEGDSGDLEDFASISGFVEGKIEGWLIEDKEDDLLLDLINDELEDNISSGDWDNCRVQIIRIPERGIMELMLDSDDFDPILALLEYDGRDVDYIAYNDDFSGMNSRIVKMLDPGDYLAVVMSYESGDEGEYSLYFNLSSDSEAFDVDIIHTGEAGTIYRDEIEPGKQLLMGLWPEVEETYGEVTSTGISPCVAFSFFVDSTCFYHIDAFSEDLDPCLILFEKPENTDGQIEFLSFNDDHSELGLGSRISRVLTSGEYIAAVCPYDETAGGEISFVFQERNDLLEVINEGDSYPVKISWEEPEVIFFLNITPLIRYTVTASSTSLDSFVSVYFDDGGQLSDDDSGGDLDAELSFMLPDSGYCLITVSAYGYSGEDGDIHVSLVGEAVSDEELPISELLMTESEREAFSTYD